MTRTSLVWRALAHHARTNAAVVLGVATAVSVLTGALLVGDSVRASLRALALQRLGAADMLVSGSSFFRDELASELHEDAGYREHVARSVPFVVLDGVVEHAPSGRRASHVTVYGVDERFWEFHGVADAVPEIVGRQTLLSPALARELAAAPDDTLVLRVEQPSSIPRTALQGRRDASISSTRLITRATLPASTLGEFSLRPQQGDVRALFVPLARLQTDLTRKGLVNAILVGLGPGAWGLGSARALKPEPRSPKSQVLLEPEARSPQPFVEAALQRASSLEDLGVRVRRSAVASALVVESATGLVAPHVLTAIEEAAAASGLRADPVLTYLANTIRIGDREIPYSTVSAVSSDTLDGQRVRAGLTRDSVPVDDRAPTDIATIWLGEWAAHELAAAPGATLTLDYYLWSDEDGLLTRSATFRVAGITEAAPDPTFTPDYPGLTDQLRMSDWDPPFPVDLARVRKTDETYWDRHRGAPKAFVSLATGQRLWTSRYGSVSSVRLSPRTMQSGANQPDVDTGRVDAPDIAGGEERLRHELRSRLDAIATGAFVVSPMRAEHLAAAAGTTDFGEYFLYFSFFLVVSALLLAGLLFRLGVEQRLREVGLLGAVGFTPAAIFSVFAKEGLLLAVAGSLLGTFGALAYASLVMLGLRTWWVDAVGTTSLVMQPSMATLAVGAGGGVLAALLALALSVRRVTRLSPRSLLAGAGLEAGHAASPQTRRRLGAAAMCLALLSLLLVVLATTGVLAHVVGFFGGGTLLLGALLSAAAWLVRREPANPIGPDTSGAIARLGGRAITHRPGRATLCFALIAAATFIIVAVTAFRREGTEPTDDPRSGTGGYAVLVETVVPVMHDPGTDEGRRALDLDSTSIVDVARFRFRPGDDASCLNLYQPTKPRMLGATDTFIDANRFRFGATVDASDEEQRNPWLLLRRTFDDGAVPAIVDGNTLTYVLHRSVGDALVVPGEGGVAVQLRIVAALADTVFQSEILISEGAFARAFPHHEGYGVFLVQAAPGTQAAVETLLEKRLGDYGADAQSAADRLASFHRVENTYLSTFQTLGGLGLVLGTLGLALVLARNVLERQRELGLLRAVGYQPRQFRVMVVAETLVLVIGGMAIGTFSALVAIAPAFATRGQPLPLASIGWLLAGVGAAGLLASLFASRLVARLPLLAALRAE